MASVAANEITLAFNGVVSSLMNTIHLKNIQTGRIILMSQIGYKVSPKFMEDKDQVVSKTYMTRVETERPVIGECLHQRQLKSLLCFPIPSQGHARRDSLNLRV